MASSSAGALICAMLLREGSASQYPTRACVVEPRGAGRGGAAHNSLRLRRFRAQAAGDSGCSSQYVVCEISVSRADATTGASTACCSVSSLLDAQNGWARGGLRCRAELDGERSAKSKQQAEREEQKRAKCAHFASLSAMSCSGSTSV